MNGPLLVAAAAVCFAVQLVLCLRSGRRTVKLIPIFLVMLIMAASVLIYVTTNNWAWLIICLLAAGLLIPCGLAWLTFGIIRVIQIMR